MRQTMWSKAEKLKDQVVFEGEARGRSFFKVGDYNIVFLCNGKFTYLESCTCTAHSVYGGDPRIDMKNKCSYTIAVDKALPIKNGKIFETEDKET